MDECPAAAAPATARRRMFGRRHAPSAPLTGGERAPDPSDQSGPSDPLDVSVRREGRSAAIVTVTGLLVREHAGRLDDRLAAAFGDHRSQYVIDLRGVTCLDPTTLAAVTRRAILARRTGALVTIVPPGGSRRPVAA